MVQTSGPQAIRTTNTDDLRTEPNFEAAECILSGQLCEYGIVVLNVENVHIRWKQPIFTSLSRVFSGSMVYIS